MREGRVPGVPRQISPAAKTMVAAALGAAVVIVVAAGLRAIQIRQERLADEARARPAEGVPAEVASPTWPAVTPTVSATATASPVITGIETTISAPAPSETRGSKGTARAGLSRHRDTRPGAPRESDRGSRLDGWIPRDPGEPCARPWCQGSCAGVGASGCGGEPGGRGRVAHTGGRVPGLRQRGRRAGRISQLRGPRADRERQ